MGRAPSDGIDGPSLRAKSPRRDQRRRDHKAGPRRVPETGVAFEQPRGRNTHPGRAGKPGRETGSPGFLFQAPGWGCLQEGWTWDGCLSGGNISLVQRGGQIVRL